MTTIGDRIRKIRIEREITQAQLAKKVGVSQGTIGHIEAGRNEGSRYLIKIAEALAVSPDWLSSGQGETLGSWPFQNVSQKEYASLSYPERQIVENVAKGLLLGTKGVEQSDIQRMMSRVGATGQSGEMNARAKRIRKS